MVNRMARRYVILMDAAILAAAGGPLEDEGSQPCRDIRSRHEIQADELAWREYALSMMNK